MFRMILRLLGFVDVERVPPARFDAALKPRLTAEDRAVARSWMGR